MIKNKLGLALVVCLATLFSVGVLAGCGGKYSDVISVNKKFIAAMENFSAAMGSVKSAKEAAAALDKMAAAMDELAPEIKALNEKYPELRTGEGIPPELDKLQKRAEKAGQNYADSVMKLMPYMADPQVQAAQQRVANAMKKMQ